MLKIKMRYRTKKYILKTVQYILTVVISTVIYTIAAHTKSLPAFFELNTGDWVRKQTQEIYSATLGGSKQKITVSENRTSNFFFWNVLDFITSDPGYRYASVTLDNLTETIKKLPQNRVDLVSDLSSDFSIIHFLKNPKSKFAEVYKYEAKRHLESYDFISSFGVYDLDNNIVIKSKSPVKTNRLHSKGLFLSEHGFVVEIEYGDTVIGYVKGNWNLWKFPDLPFVGNLGNGAVGLIVDENDTVIVGNHIGEELNSLIVADKYVGPYAGRKYPYRFKYEVTYGMRVVIIYQATPVVYYIFKILIFVLLGLVLLYAIQFGSKLVNFIKQKTYEPKHVWMEESLQRSIDLNEETLKVTQESQQYIHELKEQESQRLEAIAMRIASIDQKLPNVNMLAASTKISVKKQEQEVQSEKESSSAKDLEVEEMVLSAEDIETQVLPEDNVGTHEKVVISNGGQDSDHETEAIVEQKSLTPIPHDEPEDTNRFLAEDLPEPKILTQEYDIIEIEDEIEGYSIYFNQAENNDVNVLENQHRGIEPEPKAETKKEKKPNSAAQGSNASQTKQIEEDFPIVDESDVKKIDAPKTNDVKADEPVQNLIESSSNVEPIEDRQFFFDANEIVMSLEIQDEMGDDEPSELTESLAEDLAAQRQEGLEAEEIILLTEYIPWNEKSVEIVDEENTIESGEI